LLGLTACQQPAAQVPDAAGGNAPAPFTSTKLGEGDVVRVNFEADATMNTEVKIQLDGTINLPLVGAVKAVGLTPEELRSDLMERYKKLLSVNEITVKVLVSAAGVYVSGAVLKPGRIPMDRSLTALEAIMEAGGFDLRRAKVSNVSVIRKEEGKQQRYELNLKKALKGTDPNPFYLKPYDIVHVPEKVFNL
jgi:polysaccharide export outer membrane protein